MERDGAEVVVLSELTSPEFCDRAREEVPVPFVDPGLACWKWAEMMADLYLGSGLSHCQIVRPRGAARARDERACPA